MNPYVERVQVSFEPTYFKEQPLSGIRKEIKEFVNEARDLAKQILSANKPLESSSESKAPKTIVIRQYHNYGPWYSPWWDSYWWDTPFYHRRTVYVHTDSCSSSNRRKKDDDDEGAKLLIGLTAVVVGGITLFALGSAIPRYIDAGNELSKTQRLQLILEDSYQKEEDNEIVEETKKAAELKERICSRIKNSAAADLALRTSMLAGSSMALAWAFSLASPAFMTAGVITGLASAGGMLFKWGLDSNDSQNIRDAHALKRAVKELDKQL